MQDTPSGGVLLRELMEAFEIDESFRPGVISVVTNIRDRHAFDTSQAAREIVRRVSGGLVERRSDLDHFAQLVEQAADADIAAFLSTPDITADDFAAVIRENATVGAARRLFDEIQLRMEADVPFSDDERARLAKLREALNAALREG